MTYFSEVHKSCQLRLLNKERKKTNQIVYYKT
jgi:hypothetical protein